MLVYSPNCTTRLTYTLDFIASVLSIQITATDDWVQFTQSPVVVKMVYGNPTTEAPYYRIQPQGILASTDIGPIDLKMAKCRQLHCFFSSENDHHGFDVLGVIFFLLSRYEEYLPHELDSYGRYAHTNSIAYQQHFLDQPLVNFFIIDWVQQLQQWYGLEGATKELPEITPSIQWIPTYDIDIAFAYHHQPLLKNIGGFFKQLLLGNWENVLERAIVYAGKAEDPFDVYGWLQLMHESFGVHPHYFFLVAQDKGQYDKNITPTTLGMRQLIWQHTRQGAIGIHPSWKSGDKHALLQQEINTLKEITQHQQPCTSSRQHYIRMQMPETYRRLISCGITDDYSMGYGSINGFRASVASPFYWFDLEKNQPTNLLLHPFCFMDANAFFEQHQTAEEAGTSLQHYHDTIKQVGGQLITVFHNHFLTQQPAWQDWRNMYERFAVKNFR